MSTVLNLSHRMNLPSYVKDTFLQFLQDFFTQDPDFTWNENDQLSRIIISDRNTLNLEAVAHKPAVCVVRTPLRSMEVGVNQFRGHKLAVDERYFKDMIQGNVTIQCLSRVGLEAEDLATTVYLLIQSLKEVLYMRGLSRIQGLTIGEESVVDKTSEYEIVMVPVSIPYYISLSWYLHRQCMKLNGVDITFMTFQNNNPNNPPAPEILTEDIVIENINDNFPGGGGLVLDPFTETQSVIQEESAINLIENNDPPFDIPVTGTAPLCGQPQQMQDLPGQILENGFTIQTSKF